MKENEIHEFLKKRGLSPSYQRTKIFEYMYNNPIHPSVDEIYKNLSPFIPTL